MLIAALVRSVDDPQLPRCMDAVRNQTVPFSSVVHVDCVCPCSKSFSQGISQVKEEWVVDLGGDMILDPDGLDKIKKFMGEPEGKVSGYYVGLYDTFLKCRIGYLSALNVPLYKSIEIEDHPVWDWKVVRMLQRDGWTQVRSLSVQVGTHFDNPDEYQVFKRCYIHGFRYARYPRMSLKPRLRRLLKETGNPLYDLGLKAVEYGETKRYYPGSHNMEFDRKNYDEWRRTGGVGNLRRRTAA